MKRISFLLAVLGLLTINGFSQSTCLLTASASSSTITCGVSTQLTASGVGGVFLMNNNFNSGSAGPGWTVSAAAQFNNPCGTSLDNSTYMWMGSNTGAPREMATVGYNVQCTGTICFDLQFATGGSSPCEAPDEADEGVDLMYSTDGGATWVSIFYFDPTTGLYNDFQNYCFNIPAGAISPNTMFRWYQDQATGNDYDHWGIDNVNITLTGPCATPAPYYYSWVPSTGLSATNIANPVASPLTSTTYTVYYTNGVDDTCSVVIPVSVNVPSADAGTMQSICLGQSATLNGSGSSNTSPLVSFNNNTSHTIPDAGSTTSQITVSGLSYSTVSSTSINQVCLNITHGWTSDLDIVLLCPDGTQLVLAEDNVDNGDNYGNTTGGNTCFSPSATNVIGSAGNNTPPWVGVYAPEGTGGFNTFNGCTANGVWTLQVTDDEAIIAGTLNSWSISFNNILNPGISWSPTTNMTGSATFTPTVTPTAAGTTQYTLSVTGNPGCTTVDTVTLVVSELTGVSVSPSGTICQSDSLQLNATGGVNYSWSPATGLSSASVANPKASPATSTNYTVTISDGGCSSVQTVSVTVNPRPATDAGANVAFCINDSVQLNASGADTYTWLPATGLSNPAIANPIANGSTPVTYTVTGVITATGCFRTDSVTVTVNPRPIANAGVDTGFCAGGSVGLQATGGGTYDWLPATMANSTVSNPTVSPASTQSYTLTVANSFGCTDKDTILVTVHTLPIVNAGTNSFACPNTGFTPPAISVTGSSPFTYAWTPAGTISDPTIMTPAFTPTVSPTQYTLTATDAFGCVASDIVTISLRNLPTGSVVAQNPNICPGASTNLAASLVPAPASYTWTPTSSVISPNTSSTATSTLTTTTTFTLDYTTSVANGSCAGTRTVTVNVLPVPTADAGTDVNLCPGATATLNGSGGGTYLWAPATGLDDPTLQSPTTSAAAPTQYTLTLTGSNGCKDTASVWAFPRPNPVPGIIDSTDNGCLPVPSGSLTMQGPSVGTAPFTYVLNNGTPQSSNAFTGLTAGNYTITVTDSYGCSASDDATVVQATAPTPGIVIPTDAGCTVANGTLTMQAPTGGLAPFAYTLSGGPTNASGIFTNLTTGSYTITVTDANGCSAANDTIIAQSAPPVAGSVDATPSACTSSTGTVSMQTPSGIGPFTYALSGVSGTQSSATFTAQAPGSYTLTVIDANGCTAQGTATVTTQNSPVMNGLSATDATCTAANGSVTVAAPTGGVPPYTYQANNGTAQSSPVITGLTTGPYTITVTDAGGCTATDIITVPQVVNAISVDTAAITSTVCGAAPTGSINVVNTGGVNAITGGLSPYTYSVNGGTTYQASPLFSNLAGGNYPVMVKDANGCESTVNSFYVGANITANAAFAVTPITGPAPLSVTFVNNSTNATGYVWSYPDSLVSGLDFSTATIPPNQLYTSPGIYLIQLMAYNNIQACASYAWYAVTVFDKPTLIIPNVVTPNGDGINDEFKMSGNNFKTVDVAIFDRWGREVTTFKGDINTATWKPSGISEGTYFYTVVATSLDDTKQEFSGYISVFDVK